MGMPSTYLRADMDALAVGFACIWDRGDRSRTWSHTPQRLWEALERRRDVRVVDMPLRIPLPLDFLGRVASMRRLQGKRYSTWTMRSWYSQLAHNDLMSHERHHAEVDTILCIGEHGSTTNAPLYVYQDFCFGHGLQLMDRGLVPHGWDAVSRAALERRAAQQAETYARAAGVFTMSAWNAAYLRDAGLVPPDRIHVVHAGVNVPVDPPSADRMAMRAEAREHVVAFVGRDFARKGGDLVVAAVQQLRGMLSRPVRLVVAGPSQWPMDGPVPDGVTFLGDAPFHGVRALLRTADVLVMPSRFEAFGIIIAEALGSGTPVVGRNDFAMPEMIRHGENGMLVEGDAADELAHALFHVISSDHIASTCAADAERVRSYFSWDRVAGDMTAVLRKGRS